MSGTMGFPWAFENDERITYLPIAREPKQGRQRTIADPATRRAEALGMPGCRQPFLIITRTRQEEADMTGGLPRGAPERIEATPRQSPTFAVAFDGPTAKVFTLTESGLQ